MQMPSIVFVEPSERVKKLMSQDNNDIDIIKNTKEFNVQYTKKLTYFYDYDNNVVIIDNNFCDMFSTAFVKILYLPEVFITQLDKYCLIVHLLYKQLKFIYDEKEISFSKFRRDVFDKICNLTEGHFERYS